MTDLSSKQKVQLRAEISGYGGAPLRMSNDDPVQYAEYFVVEYGELSFKETKLDEAVAAAAALMARHEAQLADDTHKILAQMVQDFCSNQPALDNEPAPAPMAM